MGWEHPSNQKRRRLQCRKGSLCLASRSLGRPTLTNSGKHWFNWHHIMQPCKDNNPIKYDFRTIQVNCINNPIYPLILCRLSPLCLMQTSHETKPLKWAPRRSSAVHLEKNGPLKRLSAAKSCHNCHNDANPLGCANHTMVFLHLDALYLAVFWV